VKRVALGTALAMLLSFVPALFVGSAQAVVGSSTVHVINGQPGPAGGAIDVYFSGIKLVEDLGLGQGVDVTVPADTPLVTACSANSTSVDGAGVCHPTALENPLNPALNVGPGNSPITIGDEGNYTLVITGVAAPLNFTNDLGQTGLNEARFTFHNASLALAFDVCINGVKVVTALAPGLTATVSITAVQGATYAVFPAAAGCATPQGNVNFVAGTNFVQTVVIASNPFCTTGCVQVLFVGEGTVPNNPSTVTFCNTVLSLAGIGGELKALVGEVDPTSHATILATQPSIEDMSTFVNNTQVILNAGDASVPPEIADAWEHATAGLRALLQTFRLAGFQLSNLPQEAVQEIVEGANGFVIPGVPIDDDVLGATTAITAFFISVCNTSPPAPPAPGPQPQPAVQVVTVQPRFTG